MNEKYTALAELVKMVLELQVFTVLCPRCVNALTLEVSRFVFADCVKQINQRGYRTFSKITSRHLTNKIIVSWHIPLVVFHPFFHAALQSISRWFFLLRKQTES